MRTPAAGLLPQDQPWKKLVAPAWHRILLAVVAGLFLACGAEDDTPSGAPAAPDSLPRQNRLALEKSPYLLQHASNPVDWYPWGEEAFARARAENKPIFLSIGYSTCHWCHVMAHESFEDPQIASFLNQHFVAIKVDREERPDIDRIYMAFVQATTRRGGWPLNVFLTPDRKPFLGGTYFPPKRAGELPGFLEVLQRVAERWADDPATLQESAGKIVEQLQSQSHLQHQNDTDTVTLSSDILETAAQQLQQRFDPVYGGFGRAPKFPRPAELLFLHREFRRSGAPALRDMSVRTLQAMARGGIHDQLGGGFHRYSTDAFWRQPHFEKMLYDQAQLVVAFLEAYQLSGDALLAETARGTLDYVVRDMRHPSGGFYSAQDADSADPDQPGHNLEGAYYVWSSSELDTLLTPELQQWAFAYYGIEAQGNLTGSELRGKSVLYVSQQLSQVADSLGISTAQTRERLRQVRDRLLRARARRPAPHLDDKILTGWNGLMISAFARGAQVLQDDTYARIATEAAQFILDHLWDAEHEQLRRRWRDGEAAIAGFNSDYAFFVQALLDLSETTFDLRWLDWAERLTARQIELFADTEAGAFFDVTPADSTLLYRTREFYDGSVPTANSVTALNLLRLGEITNSKRDRDLARRILEYYSLPLRQSPLALPSLLIALDWQLGTPRQIVVAGNPSTADTRALLRTVHERFLPRTILLLADGGETQKKLSTHLPELASMGPIAGAAAAFVCEHYSCQLPVTDPQMLAKQLDSGN